MFTSFYNFKLPRVNWLFVAVPISLLHLVYCLDSSVFGAADAAPSLISTHSHVDALPKMIPLFTCWQPMKKYTGNLAADCFHNS